MKLGETGATYLSFPPNFQTAENRAMGYAVDRQMKKLLAMIRRISVWSDLDKVDPKYYDFLAASLRAPYYSSEYDDDIRLGILKKTLQTYMFSGTVLSEEELLKNIFSDAEFIPWYEYNGKPYHFRISVHGGPVRDTMNKFREILKRVKSKRSVLDAVEYIINFIIHMPEEMDIIKTRLHTQIFFWDCDILNGTRLLDGSVLVDAGRRYNLVLGIKNGIRFCIKENIGTDRVCMNILSCFNANEKFYAAGSLFRLGGFGFWFSDSGLPGEYKLPLKISLPSYVNVKQNIDTACLVNGGIKVNTEEKTGAVVDLKAVVNFLHGCRWETGSTGTVTKTRHSLAAKTQNVAENITITYRRNLCYLDGSEMSDGSRLLNAFYGKEEI